MCILTAHHARLPVVAAKPIRSADGRRPTVVVKALALESLVEIVLYHRLNCEAKRKACVPGGKVGSIMLFVD